MIDGNWAIFCYGAKHKWIGTITYAGYTFASDQTDPLQFIVDQEQGYVYVKGKGSVTLPDKTIIAFPGLAGTIPTGSPTSARLEVIHYPNPAKFQSGGASGAAYTCVYKTSVKAIGTGVQIEKFGTYFWANNQWVHNTSNNQPWSPQEFADWYSCPGAYIGPGQECSDPNNWNGSDTPGLTKVKWYYIGVDDNGNEVQGESVIECQP